MSHLHIWQWAAEHAQGTAAVVLIILVQSTILIALGLLAARIAGRNSSAAQSATLRTVLLAVLVCPIAGGLFDRIGLIRVRLHLPDALPLRQAPHAVWPIAIGVAMLISAALAVRLAVALRMVRRIRQGATSAPLGWIEDAGRCARVFRVTPPPVLVTDYFNTPCLVGWGTPAILVPMGAGTLRSEVLIHELAHVRRRDCFWNLFARATTALLWFQPLMWVLVRRLEQAADEACDDFVVAYGSDRADYAHQLVDMAERHQMSWVHPGCAVGMATMKSAVARRVVRIMDDSRGVSALARRAMTFVVVMILCFGAGLATLFQVADSVAMADAPAAASPRLPVPDAASLAKAEKLVRDAFGNYPATALKDRPAMAAKMIQGGIDTQGNDAGRYVLLKDGMDLAAGVGDAADALKAADELARLYAVNGNDLRLELTRKASLAATTPAAAQSVAEIGLKCADDAVALGDYDAAMKFLAPTEAAAHRISPVVASIQNRATEIRWMHQESMYAKSAEVKRSKNPDDADANLAIGRFQCMVRMNWKQGLPDLLKGSNPAFRAAAANDLSNPTHFDKQVAAGDLWWDLAEKEQNGAQAALRRRAAYWYTQAVADSTFGGLQRVLTEKRISQSPPPAMPSGDVANVPPDSPSPIPNVSNPTSPDLGAHARNVMLFVSNRKLEEPIFKAIGGGKVDTIEIPKAANTLATANPFAGINIVVFGPNRLGDTPTALLNEAASQKLVQFVDNGGDLVLFEQSRDDNFAILEKNFGIHKHPGGPYDFIWMLPALAQTMEPAGVDAAALKKMRFYQGYDLSDKADVLVTGGSGNKAPVAAIVPHGRGRVILFGGSLESNDLEFAGAYFNYVYRSNATTSETPAPAANGVNSIGMKLVLIPAGEFDMGSPPAEVDRQDVEALHHVKISQAFLMATTPVTQGQFTAVMGNNPSHFKGDDRPVEQVSYEEAVKFCDELSHKEGKHYRLPTEAEWEYACRAGTQTPFNCDDGNIDDYAWSSANSKKQPHDVATRKPNRWGLYDMNGNVWQWCSDGYGPYGGDAVDPKGAQNPNSRARRGGSWHDPQRDCRSARRKQAALGIRYNDLGFRVCLDSDQMPAAVAAGDLLAKVNLPADIVEGPWTRDADGITSPGDRRGARLRILSNPPPEYDLRAVFTIHDERANFGFLLAHNDASGMWKIDCPDNCRFRGAGDPAHMMPEKIARLEPKLTLGAKHEVIIKVRNDSISTFIDGKPMGQITEDYSQCRLEPYWSIGSHAIGLANGDTNVTFHSVELNAVSETPSPATPTNSFPTGAIGAKNVLLFVGNPKEEALFKGIGADVHVVKSQDTTKMMVNPQMYAQSNVIVWGRNTMTIPPENSFTDAAWESMRHFMENGGDLILFEQSAGNPTAGAQLKTNWSYIEKTFGIKMSGGAITGASLNADILPYTPSDVQTGEFLAKVVFFNDYVALPASATVLVYGRSNHNHAVVAGVPVGKGRLILIGTNLSPADEPLDRVIIQYIYAKRSAKSGSGAGPRSIFDPEPAGSSPAGQGAMPSPNVNGVSKETLAFAKERNALPPDKQIAATLAKLKEINGGDIRADLRADANGNLLVDIVNQDALVNLEPLYGLKVTKLNLDSCRKLRSLNGVQGMPLTDLNLTNCFALDGDLSVLKGMPLTRLGLRDCRSLKSLNGIAGMALTELNLDNCFALEGDLSTLQGMHLTQLRLGGCTKLQSLNGIQGMPLTGELNLAHGHCLEGDLSALKGMQLSKLDLYECFKLGSLKGIEGMPLTELNLTDCHALEGDLSVLKGMPLKKLNLYMCENITSLAGLEGAPLKDLVLTRRLGQENARTILQVFPTLEKVNVADQKMNDELAAQIAQRKAGNLVESGKPAPATAAPRPPGSSIFTPDTDPAPKSPNAK